MYVIVYKVWTMLLLLFINILLYNKLPIVLLITNIMCSMCINGVFEILIKSCFIFNNLFTLSDLTTFQTNMELSTFELCPC